jgi:hypothetical protein
MTQADLLNVFRSNVETIKRALNGDTSGHVYVWPEHWLAVKFDRDNCRAVGITLATFLPTATSNAQSGWNGKRRLFAPSFMPRQS